MTDPKPADEVETPPCVPTQAEESAGTPHNDGSTFSDGAGYGD